MKSRTRWKRKISFFPSPYTHMGQAESLREKLPNQSRKERPSYVLYFILFATMFTPSLKMELGFYPCFYNLDPYSSLLLSETQLIYSYSPFLINLLLWPHINQVLVSDNTIHTYPSFHIIHSQIFRRNNNKQGAIKNIISENEIINPSIMLLLEVTIHRLGKLSCLFPMSFLPILAL